MRVHALALALLFATPALAQDVWPNAKSKANSDRWLVENHDKIRVMRPRVLVVNFANGFDPTRVRAKVDELRANLRESSRWQGYKRPTAPAFLDYQVAKYVDLSDDALGSLAATATVTSADGNGTRMPRNAEGRDFEYAPLYSEEFGKLYGLGGPLKDLVEKGEIHEVWFLARHGFLGSPWETVEVKATYDEKFKATGGHNPFAGNSGGHSAPWIGRSLRILFFNVDRGVGCAMESLGHSLERMGTCNAIPYLKKYLGEYAGFDLDKRWKLPFDSFYGKGPKNLRYPDPRTLVYERDGKEHKVERYVVAGGNVHFPPNGRHDYDMANDAPVLSTIEGWRQRGGWDGKDKVQEWTPAVLAPYRSFSGDCMGAWVVYWRQNMPGWKNKARDDEGRPMKNWWPFLFY